LSLVLFRKSLKKWIDVKKNDADEDFGGYIGKHCIADSDFLSGIGGKVSFNGTLWNAHSDKEVKKGDTLIIKAVENIHLIVEPI
jgi:membrane protein implicated in regulation of membrane protease activity